MKKAFANPPTSYRPAPFWAINDRITPEECSRQMQDMLKVGLSGGFFHSRAGLITDYMGEEWFKSMDAALEAAKNGGGYLWLYDEDLWPSGNAGGKVAMMKDEYRNASLFAYLVAAGQPIPKMAEDYAIVFAYAIESRDGRKVKGIKKLDSPEDSPNSERLLMVRKYDDKIEWWSGESYSNLLHPEAMQEFIKMTHEVYKEHYSKEFGKAIPGIFTDEPHIGCFPECAIPWYHGLPDLYAKWYGRDFVEDLPYLVFEGPSCRKIRLLINRTIHKQFMEAYCKPLYEWCEANNLKHTGHFLWEDDLFTQTQTYGGGVMSFYKYQHTPGIDHLCRDISNMQIACKQVSSAARQLGRRQVLTEIFGVSRHTNTFEDFRWVGDFDMVFGATFFCPHLSWYSARGKRKRDYPPVWNYQQTYWKDLRKLNEYFGRTAFMLDQGEAVCDVAMLHPIDSAVATRELGVKAFGSIEGNNQILPLNPPVEAKNGLAELNIAFKKAMDSVLTSGRDCDLVCEDSIVDMGKVKDGKLVVGKMSYSTLVVPPSITWRPETYETLKEFIATGGKVLFIGRAPVEIDGEDAVEKWKELLKGENVKTVPSARIQIQEAIDTMASQDFILRDLDGNFVANTYLQHRKVDNTDIFFIVNTDRNRVGEYVLDFPDRTEGNLVEWDAMSGKVTPCMSVDEDARFTISIPACSSVILTMESGEMCADREEEPEFDTGSEMLPETFDFKRSDPNVLVIDRIQVSYDGGKTFEAEDLEYRVRRQIANHFGTTSSLGWQPWVAIRKKLYDGKGGPIVIRYKFESDLAAPKACVVIEDIQKGKLFINGTEVSTATDMWQWDRGFGKVELGEHIVKGKNIIDFHVDYDFLTEVETAYIVGDFGVELIDPYYGKLVAEPRELKTGSWVNQGFPFYCGKMTYITKFENTGENTLLQLRRPSGTLFNVKVNGKPAGSILWRPYELDISKFVKDGENTLEIEVVSSLQNTLGPIHEINGDDNMWCGPNAFDEDVFIREEFSLFDYGLIGGGEILQ